ncbi:MAG TPA: hypothetical protein VFU47_15465, partial [Armatimonadota bacterium]|nr:hypothetical protein [Armatimonadota bacterium]
DLRRMAETDFPEFKDAPCLLTESGSSVAESPRANTACEAARMAALLDANARSGRGMDLLFRSGDLADDHFNGYRPLISRVGDNTVPLPAFRFNMLAAKLGAERLKTETPAGVGAFATRPSARAGRNATQVLLYRYDPALADGRGEELAVRLRVAGLPNTLLRLPMRLYRIDPEHGAPYEAWVAAGKPKPAPKELGQKLLGASPFAPADESPGVPINSGEAVIDLKLPPNSVALVTLGAETASEPALCDRGKRLRKAEAEFGAALQAPTTEKAIDGLRRIAERYADSYWREQALMALAGIYQLSVRSPEQAEAVRKELLTLPLDDVARLRLLQRLRVDAARKAEPGGVEGISRQIAELESRLAEQRQSTLRRYTGE